MAAEFTINRLFSPGKATIQVGKVHIAYGCLWVVNNSNVPAMTHILIGGLLLWITGNLNKAVNNI